MNSREILILRTLQFKELHTQGHSLGGDLVDQFLESENGHREELFKNVCAKLPLELVEEIENLSSMLQLNKREMITMALNDFLKKARDIIEEFDAFPEEV